MMRASRMVLASTLGIPPVCGWRGACRDVRDIWAVAKQSARLLSWVIGYVTHTPAHGHRESDPNSPNCNVTSTTLHEFGHSQGAAALERDDRGHVPIDANKMTLQPDGISGLQYFY